ncbi:MAG TPA: rhomboid family intramembrane serine protease [Jiangellaceae bacterium]
MTLGPRPEASAPPKPAGALWTAPLLVVAIMWVAEIVDAFTPQANLDEYGIQPRSDEGLIGILAAPFLHGGFGHLIANTTAFVILGLLVVWASKSYWAVTFGVIVLGGLGVWLIAAPGTVHIGASGLVYGYAAFLVAWGFFTRHTRDIVIGILVALAYGGLVTGLLPTQPGVSWQGHLFGAIAGILMASWLSRRRRPARPRR